MYGYCPYCGEECNYRERSPNGNTRCIKGHSFPHHQTLSKRPVHAQLVTLPAIYTLPPDEELESLIGNGTLDETLLSLKKREATELNSRGIGAQLDFLRAYLAPEAFANLIHELID